MIRVQTQWHGDNLRFTQNNGTTIDHAPDFEYNGRQYNFLGGFYYDLEPALIDHLFN